MRLRIDNSSTTVIYMAYVIFYLTGFQYKYIQGDH